MKEAKQPNTRFTHTRLALNLFAAHYRQAPLQAAAILIGIVLAVTLFVAVQAINLNAKRSYAESTEQLSAQAQSLIIPPPTGKTICLNRSTSPLDKTAQCSATCNRRASER